MYIHSYTNQGFDGYDRRLPLAEIKLSETTPPVNEIVYSPEIKRSPVRFAAYLRTYFQQHTESRDDLLQLNGFRPWNASTNHMRLITFEHTNETIILGGNHRATAHALNGHESIHAYLGIRNAKRKKSMNGDSTFLTLRKLYERYKLPEQRQYILEVTAMLARVSTDGRGASQTYWITYARKEAVRRAGQELLKRIRTAGNIA